MIFVYVDKVSIPIIIEPILKIYILSLCYGPYKQVGTNSQKRVRPTRHQCARGGTDGTSGTIGQGVAESHRRHVTRVRNVGTWERGNVGTWERGNVGTWERGNVGT